MNADTLNGRSISIGVLTVEDVDRWQLVEQMGNKSPSDFVAVHVTDLAECLAAVVDPETRELVWSDADGEGSPIALPSEFVLALARVVDAVTVGV